jgi:hypothetical protein
MSTSQQMVLASVDIDRTRWQSDRWPRGAAGLGPHRSAANIAIKSAASASPKAMAKAADAPSSRATVEAEAVICPDVI